MAVNNGVLMTFLGNTNKQDWNETPTTYALASKLGNLKYSIE
jgi:hypothetical protein